MQENIPELKQLRRAGGMVRESRQRYLGENI
jgi:hypothetical protein